MPRNAAPPRPDLIAKINNAARARQSTARAIATRATDAPTSPKKRSKAATDENGMPAPRENVIQTHIMGRLRYNGWLVVRFNGGGFEDKAGQFVKNYIIQGLNSACGFPDVVAFKDGRALLIEVKTPKGKPSPAQMRFANFARNFGMPVYLLRNTDGVDDLLDGQPVETVLETLKKSKT